MVPETVAWKTAHDGRIESRRARSTAIASGLSGNHQRINVNGRVRTHGTTEAYNGTSHCDGVTA